jgi:hypothetical protein
MQNPDCFILLFLFIILFYSCNLSETNDKSNEALKFLKKIEKNIDNVTSPSDSFTRYFSVVAPIAKRNTNYQLAQTQIDSLSKYYARYISGLDETIKELNNLEEFDTSFGIAKTTTNSFQILKKAYESTIPTYLYIYKTGLKLASESEEKILMNGDKILNNAITLFNRENTILDTKTKEFMHKYNVRY